MQNLYNIALTTHIIGLSAMAGVTLVEYIIVREFWKEYGSNTIKAIAINDARTKLPLFFVLGISLLILSGVTMMSLTKGAFGAQIWFKIKFTLVLLIITNSITVGRRHRSKLNDMISPEYSSQNLDKNLLQIRNIFNWFFLTQMIFFIAIFILSVFKFN